jgi:cell division protein FtsI (penicillin-binding protein 3)/stage V sporulation protein D (sporulation-specific penicillin-binding protein)
MFTGFSFRLIDIQVNKHEDYVQLAAENHGLKQIIHARRGSIVDVNGLSLAQNEPVKTVIADGSLIKDRPAVAKLLSEQLEIPVADLEKKLQRTTFSKRENAEVPSRYIVLKKDVPELVATRIDEEMAKAKHRGINFEQEAIRVYPNGDTLCHVIGFTHSENKGGGGVELTMDDYLRGHDGFRFTERDRRGAEMVPYRGQERPARNGCDVRLTVDLGLQGIVEAELDAACKQYRPQMAVVILLRPQTGEILAMANRPNFNANVIKEDEGNLRINRAIMDQVEPGSTFKIVTTAAALSQKLVTPETSVFCENGNFTYGGKTLHDHHPYGELNVTGILVKSSNIGVAKLGMQLGDQRLYEFIRRFGFGERTGINLPMEITGTVNPPHRWSKISITHIPMGHEVAATPLQVVSAMATIANGGKLMVPQIVKDIKDENGNLVTAFPPTMVRQVVSEETANQVRDALIEVVSKRGTAQLAAVPGFKVGGKTGTAQKINPKGGYERGKYVVSFAGFMPAENPEFAALVMLDDAKVAPNLNYGGLIAAPIFQKIAEKAARYLNLEPTEPLVPVVADASTEHMRD